MHDWSPTLPHSSSPPGWAALFHAEDPEGSSAVGPPSYHFLQNQWGWLLHSTLHKGSCSCQSKCCSSETPYFTYQTLKIINLLLLLKISSCSFSQVYFRCWDLSIFSCGFSVFIFWKLQHLALLWWRIQPVRSQLVKSVQHWNLSHVWT